MALRLSAYKLDSITAGLSDGVKFLWTLAENYALEQNVLTKCKLQFYLNFHTMSVLISRNEILEYFDEEC